MPILVKKSKVKVIKRQKPQKNKAYVNGRLALTPLTTAFTAMEAPWFTAYYRHSAV